ncbi:MAG TPA: amidohydrolase family protein [Hanamia sp.]|nr:amidohydrolase family protein [Hanamia sp.]
MIDTHIHFWNYNKIKDTWITDEMKVLQRDFLPEHLENELSKNNVEGIVAVQADQSENETQFLSDLADKNSIIKGIVGWVDLQSANIERKLLYYLNNPKIKGFRHIVQSENEGFLANKKFLNGISFLKKAGFTYDILIYENQLKEAIKFVNKFPDQKFIIDHCAKPGIKNKSISEWKTLMKEIARNENVCCKISGLITEAKWNEWNEKDLYPYLDAVFESFGTERLLFGSDWPVMLLSGNYTLWKNLLEKYMSQFPSEQKQKVFRENAIYFYNLNI